MGMIPDRRHIQLQATLVTILAIVFGIVSVYTIDNVIRRSPRDSSLAPRPSPLAPQFAMTQPQPTQPPQQPPTTSPAESPDASPPTFRGHVTPNPADHSASYSGKGFYIKWRGIPEPPEPGTLPGVARPLEGTTPLAVVLATMHRLEQEQQTAALASDANARALIYLIQARDALAGRPPLTTDDGTPIIE